MNHDLIHFTLVNIRFICKYDKYLFVYTTNTLFWLGLNIQHTIFVSFNSLYIYIYINNKLYRYSYLRYHVCANETSQKIIKIC
ncbi:hypothetical protein C2G38_1540535 [Gigaspora rosea]|uniref:Uncharacterized protein n=1 Tax=Gigaspora rosea TaxID=44941 RepID=A0A397V0N5_9GLOM|nr:hypothetical protein C2G38_1540535 [Gigaspora rosea]